MKTWSRFLVLLVAVATLVFCFCSCGGDKKTNDGAEKATDATAVASETVAETEDDAVVDETTAQADDDVADDTITEEEAIEMVESKYPVGEDYGYMVRDVEEVNGVSYYGVDLRKLVNGTSTYQTTYFVSTDGVDIIEGYYENDEPVLVGPKNEITEEEAIEMVESKYPVGEDYGYMVRDVEEIDGYCYYGVDLRKLVNGTSTYQTTYFVAVNGSEIREGYYEGDKPVLVD